MDLAKSVNISLLGNVIVDYHRKNNYWPQDGLDLEHFYDSAKLIFQNFDTLSFSNESNNILVEYRFIENPSSPGPITFVGRDEAGAGKSQIEWCYKVYEKIDHNFEGQLLFKYEDGYYKCK